LALSRTAAHREHGQVDFDRNGLALLDASECRSLLGASGIGRLALSVHALPVVLPVNFMLMADGILIRTGAGSKFEQACDHAVVGFEIDGYDPLSHSGWSVLVQGHARVLQTPAELAEAHQAGLTPWGNPTADTFVKVSLDIVTGRRLGGWYWPHGLPHAPLPEQHSH
jgi:nitroimidazol reductase NimA-like FMN-containing flavoprotein (pyridoxamine 5'-phosphate oxidase superfamily)